MTRTKKILSVLLSACLTLSMYSGIEALGQEYGHAEGIQTAAVSGAPTASRSDIADTEENIEKMHCDAAEGGCHVLGSTSGIYPHPDNPSRLVRGEMEEKYYEASCTHGSGTSSLRPCQYCNTWFTVIVDDGKQGPTQHQFEAEQREKSDCDGLTYITQTCSVCGFVEVKTEGDKPIDLKKHTQCETGSVNHNDCKTDNVKITTCQECGIVIACESIGPKGHSGVTRLTKNGTCKENGAEVFECYNCSETFTTVLETKDKHFYTNKGKSPTCTEPGWKESSCIWCNTPNPEHPGREEIPKSDHKWEDMESSACTNEKVQRCVLCGEMKTEGGDQIVHTWKEEVLTMPATCTEAGYTYKECRKCGAIEKVQENTEEPTGHDYTIPVILQQATCGVEGQETKRCSKCQALSEETTVIPATNKHTPAADDGDCTTPVLCTVCNQTVVEAKPDHDWKYTAIASLQGAQKQHKKTCKSCKTTETEYCSGNDDGDCTTPIICQYCNSTIKDGSMHVPGYEAKRKYIPVPGEMDEYHIALCSHTGCSKPVESSREAHTYVNGKCTKCEHVHGKEHIPDGIYESDGEYHWQHCTLCGAKTELEVHDVSKDSPYEGDCTQAVRCGICYGVVREASSHNYEGSWQTTGENHYRVCINPGCEVQEKYKHNVIDDYDCTTPNTCKDCGLVIVEGTPNHSWVYDGSGHTETGHSLICTNNDCHQEKTEEHIAGIVANCTEQAECKICHTKFGSLDPSNHNGGEEIRNAKEATEEEEGYTGDVYCLGCQQIKQPGSVIEKKPAHEHQYTEFQYDETAHTPKCSICGKLKEEERSDHVWGAWEVLENGEGHSRSCIVCQSVQRGAHEHSEAVPDCTADITCVTCKAVIVEGKQSHQFNGRVEVVGDGHTIACTNENCQVSSTPVPHTGGEASCQSGAHCEVCGAEYGEKNPNVHTGGEEQRNHKNPTTTEKGYTGDIYCLGCQTLLKEGEEIDMIPEEHTHTFGDWKSDITNHWKECDCGAIENNAEHQYEKGVCLVCGAKDPSYSGDPGILVEPDNGIEAEIPVGQTEFYKDVKLVVDKLSASDKDYASILNTVGKKYKTFVPFDIRLFDTVTGQNIQPNSSLTIRVPVPEGWAADKTLVYHVEGDTMTAVKTSLSQDGKYVTFTVDHLSFYVLVNAESEKKDDSSNPGTENPGENLQPSNPGTENPGENLQPSDPGTEDPGENLQPSNPGTEDPDENLQPSSPQTGDDTQIFLWFVLAGLSAAGLIGLLLSEKHRRKIGILS